MEQEQNLAPRRFPTMTVVTHGHKQAVLLPWTIFIYANGGGQAAPFMSAAVIPVMVQDIEDCRKSLNDFDENGNHVSKRCHFWWMHSTHLSGVCIM